MWDVEDDIGLPQLTLGTRSSAPVLRCHVMTLPSYSIVTLSTVLICIVDVSWSLLGHILCSTKFPINKISLESTVPLKYRGHFLFSLSTFSSFMVRLKVLSNEN
jgi:hypothetical protein